MSAAPEPKPRRRWWRRIFWTLLLLVIAARIALPWALAWVADSYAKELGLTCRWREFRLGILAGELRVQGLELHARNEQGEPSGEALLRVDLLGVDLRTTRLFSGELDLALAELDGVDLRVERREDGGFVWAGHLPSASAADDPASASATPTAPGEPFDFRLPFGIDVLRAQHLRVHVIDRSAATPLDTWLEANLRVNDIGRSDRVGRVELHAHGAALLDEFALDGTLGTGPRLLDARFALRVRGLRCRPLAGLLGALGITPQAERLDGEFTLVAGVTPNAADAQAIDARLTLERCALRADDVVGFALSAFDAHGTALRRDRIALEGLALRGLRARAATRADGALAVLGFELRAVPGGAAAPVAAPKPSTTRSAMPLALRSLRIDDGRFEFEDGSVADAVPLALVVEHLGIDGIVVDAATPDAQATLEATLLAPGIAERIGVSARIVPFATRRSLEAELRAEQVTLAALAPQLARAGFAPDLADGTLTLKLVAGARTAQDGALRADLALGPLALTDGERTLAGLERLGVQGVVADAKQARLRIGEIDVVGVALPMRADAQGGFHVAGLRRVPATAARPANVAPPRVPAASAKTATPLRFELGLLRARGTRVSFVDESLDPPLAFAPDEIELDVRALALGGDAADPAAAPEEAQLRARVVAPAIAEELAMTGSIRSEPGPLDVTVRTELVGNRIVAGPFAQWLERAGLQSTLRAGRFRGTVEAHAKAIAGGGVHADARLGALSFGDGDDPPFLALDELRVDDVLAKDGALSVGSVAIVGPRLRVARDADGALRALGLKLDARAVPQGALPAAPSTTPTPTPTPTPTSPTDGAPPALALHEFTLSEAQIDWSDAAVSPALDTSLRLDAHALDLSTAAGAAPGALTLRVAAKGALEALTLEAALKLDPRDFAADLKLRGQGLRAGPLSGYVPPGLVVEWKDGRLALDAALRSALAEGGGRSLEASVSALALSDGDTALLALDALRVRASRVDPAGARIAIEELVTQGLQLELRRRADGTLAVLGVVILPESAPAAATPTADVAVAESAVPTAAPAAPLGVGKPPRVTLEKLDLGVAKLRIVDEQAVATPLEASVRLFNQEPLVLLDAEPEALPPSRLTIEGAATPLLDALRVELECAPWQPDAKLVAKLLATGLRGNQLAAVFPALQERIDASGLADGALRGELELIVDLQRRTPTDIDLSRGFGIDLDLRKLELRSAAEGELLAGIESIALEAPRIVPGGLTQIGLIDIAGIKARATRDARGLHAAGITWLDAPAETAPTPPAAAPSASSSPTPTSTPTPAPSSARELRVDEFTVRGLDFVYLDQTSDPPMAIPLEGLDVEVRDFSTRTFTDGVPFRFSASLSAGKVDLPERIQASSLVSGVLGAAFGAVAGAVTGQKDERKHEQRPMLDEIAVDGRLALGPQLNGRVRASVNGLELGAFRGPAKRAGVQIGDGVLDAGATIHLHGERGIRTDASFAFNSLSLSEPPGGPISSYLKLPAPLDTVIFALRDQNGDIRIPLDVRIEGKGLSSGQIATAAISALSAVVTKAIASAPFRAAGAITGLFGIGGGEATPLADQAVRVPFATGDLALEAEQRQRLAPLAELLAGDETLGVVLVHEFSAADLTRAATLANPSPQETAAIVERLRRTLLQTIRERDEAQADLRAQVGAGDPRSAWLHNQRVATLDARIAQTGDALDRIAALLRPGAERRSDRRTRDAALDLGQSRLAAVRQALIELAGQGIAERIELRPARLGEPSAEGAAGVVATPRLRQAPSSGDGGGVSSTLSDGALASPPTRGRSSVVER